MTKGMITFGMLVMMMWVSTSCNNTVSSTTTGSNVDASTWSKKDSISYSWGMLYGDDMKSQGVDINGKLYSEGFSGSFDGSDPLIEKAVAERLMNEYMEKMMKEKETEAASGAVENNKVGMAFLAKNATREGVTTTASGLQYEVIQSGTGKTPGPKDLVSVHYTGSFMDGKVFDSSVERGQPIEFGFDKVIRGWGEVLQLMKVGDKWKVFIPSHLAYGDRGKGSIPPGETLIFEMELLDVK